jgi:dTDP-4-dehydrorhamnose reductase
VVCDLLDAGATARAVQAARPAVVIHAQALPDVDRCQREPRTAEAQNVQTTIHLVRALERLPALLVYVSTDYVFDGSKGAPYDERDAPHPINVYGQTKLAGEQVALARASAIVARTSTLFGWGRETFCDHIIARVQAGEPVDAFVDQVTTPTYTEDVADALGELVAAVGTTPHPPRRIFHVVNAGEGCSRVAFAERVVDLVGGSRALIRPVPRAQMRRDAPRPAHSAMRTVNLQPVIGRTLRPWEQALYAYLRQRELAAGTRPATAP